MAKGKPGAPKRIFDEEIIAELVDIRMKEQLPWKELPAQYMDLKGPDTDESKPDWRTLRNAMMKDVDAVFMPSRVHKKMRARMSQEFDKADLGAMMMTVLISRYGEWNLLHTKMLRNAAATGLRDDDEEKLEAPKFTTDDRNRMDELSGEVTSVIMRIGELMRNMHIEDNSLFRLMADVGGVSPAIKPYADDVKGSISPGVIDVIAEVKKSSAEMLQEINESHRALGVGHYRPREEVEVDLLEET